MIQQKRLFLVVLILASSAPCLCQTIKHSKKDDSTAAPYKSYDFAVLPRPDSSAADIDKKLSALYRVLQDGNTAYDSLNDLSAAFTDMMIHYLSSPLTFENKLDTLETLINIVQSPDKKIKFYSWDEHATGFGPTYLCYAQYQKHPEERTISQSLTANSSYEYGYYSDGIIYQVHETAGPSLQKVYLTFSEGIHSSNAHDQHQEIKMFELLPNELKQLADCLDGQKSINIHFPKNKKSYLRFNKKKNTLQFREFVWWDAGIHTKYRATGRIKTYKLVDGIFRASSQGAR